MVAFLLAGLPGEIEPDQGHSKSAADDPARVLNALEEIGTSLPLNLTSPHWGLCHGRKEL